MSTPTPTSPPASSNASIRVVIQQPALAKYRLPVFRELANRPGIDLLVAFGNEKGIDSVAPEGFAGIQVPIHDFGQGGSKFRWHTAQYRFATRQKADVVVLSWSTRYLTLVPSIFRARWNNVGTVLWGHGYSKAETRLRENSRGSIADFADAVLFYNHTTAQRFIDGRFTSPDRVFVALNTLDTSAIDRARAHWQADPARLAAFRQQHNLTGPVVLFVSRLNADNRVDMLIQAAARMRQRLPDLKVVIVGSGPEEAALKSLASSSGLSDAIHFAGAVYDESDLAPYFLSAGVFCYPVNIGLSLIHAMSYALPVVTSDKLTAQNPEIEAFREGINGRSYADGSVDAMADTLISVLTDSDQQRRLSRGAFDTVHQDFSLSKMVDGMEAAIRFAAVRRRVL